MDEKQNIQPKYITQSIEKMMSNSYIDYSMSVIVGRALPDVRDGLKPVHRRILYAMNDLGLSYRSAHKKSARVVGEVLGKYHPHGDSAAYDAMVRLAQPFSLRYPLVDGQGNFGSIDGDSAAAMRYTEARLTKMSSDLLLDIDKDTVDMVRNFDESLWEPSVLPSKFPNLLLNGSAGIAVGMATNMPPHNFCEVVDAINHTIDDPDASVQDLMQYIKGPDFPTGGTIHGLSGIVSAYNTGRGKIKVRANTHIEERGGGKVSIIVDEIPYQVNKAKLVTEIAELVKTKQLEGITDLRDESDRNGMRIVIDIHKDAIENVVLENLYKLTQMEQTFGIINLALVDGKPRVLNLKMLIEQYILHRKDVVTRRTKFDLAEAEKKMHVLEAYMAAFNMLDATIKLIRESADTEAANIGLQELLGIDEVQAKAILDLKLQKLTGLEIDSLRKDHHDTGLLIEDFKDILAHEGRILAIIKDELNEMKVAYGDERRTVIDPNAIDTDEEDLIPEEDVVITISDDGYIKRIPLRTYKEQNRGGVGLRGMQTKEEDVVANMFVTSTHDYIMFITDTGRLLWLKGYRIPEGSRQSKGKPIVNMLPDLQDDEKVIGFMHTREFTDDRFLVFCTKKGIIKRTNLSLYGNVRGTVGLIAPDEERFIVLPFDCNAEGAERLYRQIEVGAALDGRNDGDRAVLAAKREREEKSRDELTADITGDPVFARAELTLDGNARFPESVCDVLILADRFVYAEGAGKELGRAAKRCLVAAEQTEREKKAKGTAALVAIQRAFRGTFSHVGSSDDDVRPRFFIDRTERIQTSQRCLNVFGIGDPLDPAFTVAGESAADQHTVRHAFGGRSLHCAL